MKLTVFAALKDHMPAEFEVDTSGYGSIRLLKEALQKKYPTAAALLESCRFSTNSEIISIDQPVTSYEHLFIIPPSSGG